MPFLQDLVDAFGAGGARQSDAQPRRITPRSGSADPRLHHGRPVSVREGGPSLRHVPAGAWGAGARRPAVVTGGRGSPASQCLRCPAGHRLTPAKAAGSKLAGGSCGSCKRQIKPGEHAMECPAACRWLVCERCQRDFQQRGGSEVAHLQQWGAGAADLIAGFRDKFGDSYACLASKVSQEINDLTEMATKLQLKICPCDHPVEQDVEIVVSGREQEEPNQGMPRYRTRIPPRVADAKELGKPRHKTAEAHRMPSVAGRESPDARPVDVAEEVDDGELGMSRNKNLFAPRTSSAVGAAQEIEDKEAMKAGLHDPRANSQPPPARTSPSEPPTDTRMQKL